MTAIYLPGTSTTIYRETLRAGGYTHRAPEDLFAGRYVIGGVLTHVEPVDTFTPEVVQGFSLLHARGRSFGTWVDGVNVYLDVVTFTDDEDEALRIARERGERAVYDSATGQSLAVIHPVPAA